LFYQCGEAAIILPNVYNVIEGNTYAKMPGGYLNVMYPEPWMCLDLAAWQEFFGFDMTGCTSDAEIDINNDDLTMDILFKKAPTEVKTD
jgi:hypothetical protein